MTITWRKLKLNFFLPVLWSCGVFTFQRNGLGIVDFHSQVNTCLRVPLNSLWKKTEVPKFQKIPDALESHLPLWSCAVDNLHKLRFESDCFGASCLNLYHAWRPNRKQAGSGAHLCDIQHPPEERRTTSCREEDSPPEYEAFLHYPETRETFPVCLQVSSSWEKKSKPT